MGHFPTSSCSFGVISWTLPAFWIMCACLARGVCHHHGGEEQLELQVEKNYCSWESPLSIMKASLAKLPWILQLMLPAWIWLLQNMPRMLVPIKLSSIQSVIRVECAHCLCTKMSYCGPWWEFRFFVVLYNYLVVVQVLIDSCTCNTEIPRSPRELPKLLCLPWSLNAIHHSICLDLTDAHTHVCAVHQVHHSL